VIHKVIKSIDTFQDWFGFFVSLLIIPMTGVVVYEVMMRYVFHSPTTWGFELTTFIYGLHFTLGLGYTLLHNGHVKVDVFVTMMNKKKQHVVALLTTLVMLLPTFVMLSLSCIDFAWTSIRNLEHSWTSWGPPIYPLKSLMALGIMLFVLQGVSSLLKDVQYLRGQRNQ
jgi:TRAP-type mannitol/chloroaromatic compound transport system permease small subunit